MFAGVRKLYEGTFGFLSFLHFKAHAFPGSALLYLEQNLYPAMLKLPAILSDLGIAWIIYKILFELTKKRKPAIIGAAIWLFNPVIWYNSAVWGQYDAVINFLALSSFYLLYKKKLLWSMLLLAASLYIKASLLIFVPAFLVIALRQKYELKKWLIAAGSSLLALGLATFPFSRGEPFGWLYNLYVNKVFVDQLHSITANAFNLWGAVNGIHIAPQLFPESTPLLGLTYQYWGYILFAVFYIPSLWLVYKKQDIKTIVWSLAVASFSSFMLLTNMHERYLYPLFPYFTILLILIPEIFANYAAVSIISLLNMYNFWFVPNIPSIADFMLAKNNLFPRILSGINFLLFLFYYLRFVRYNFGRENAKKH